MFLKKITIKKLYPKLNIDKDYTVEEVKPLQYAAKNDLTFFDSIKYKSEASLTKAKRVSRHENYKIFTRESY